MTLKIIIIKCYPYPPIFINIQQWLSNCPHMTFKKLSSHETPIVQFSSMNNNGFVIFLKSHWNDVKNCQMSFVPTFFNQKTTVAKLLITNDLEMTSKKSSSNVHHPQVTSIRIHWQYLFHKSLNHVTPFLINSNWHYSLCLQYTKS